MEYGKLDWVEGTKNLPGVRRRAFFIAKRDIDGWPALDESAATAALRTMLAGDFTLAAGKTFMELDGISKKTKVTSEPQGSPESASVLNKVSLVHPGSEEDAADFARQANRDDYVYIVQQQNGKYRVVGSEHFRTTTKVTQDLGTEGDDSKGTTIEVECTDICLPFYNGSILTGDGDQNPAV